MKLRGSCWGVRAAGVVLLIALAAITGCTRKTAESRSDASAAAVLVSASDVAKVASRDMESGVSFTGELQPADSFRAGLDRGNPVLQEGDLGLVLVDARHVHAEGDAHAPVTRPT